MKTKHPLDRSELKKKKKKKRGGGGGLVINTFKRAVIKNDQTKVLGLFSAVKTTQNVKISSVKTFYPVGLKSVSQSIN